MALFDFLKRKRKKEEPASTAARQGGHAEAKKDGMPAPEKKGVRERASLAESRRVRTVSERMLSDVIRPHVTERSRKMSQEGVYVFRVGEESTKHTIKEAIEALYHVAVTRVRVLRIPSKPRRRGLTQGTKKGYKKAAVILRKGEHIELFS